VTNANSGSLSTIIENAFITYNGFNQSSRAVPLAFDVGYMDVPVFLYEATSSNDKVMIESPSPETVATEFGGGDARSAIGLRSYKTQYWAGAYVSGPAAGTPHNLAGSPTGEALAFLGRATYNPIQNANESLHIGVNLDHMENTGAGITAGNPTLALSDRPEDRIDPTALLTTGTLAHVNSGNVYGFEAAGQIENFFAQGEFYRYTLSRSAGADVAGGANVLNSNLAFNGGYLEGSYTIGGRRTYNPATGAYNGVVPTNPLSMKDGGGWGAVEFAGRYSRVDLNDKFVSTDAFAAQPGAEGGDQTVWSFGVNYYPYQNVKVMLDYLHINVDKQGMVAAGSIPINGSSNAFLGNFAVYW